ncbi:MAG: DUF4347 domain-containing protein, partial [Burkholderiaceae bacterium]|nr:DUF4347 domain-containing protein [Burkholderiaceae bacterium]
MKKQCTRPFAEAANRTGNGVPSGIRRRKPQPMALEARFMFDGAAMATAIESVDGATHAVAHADRTAEPTPPSERESLRSRAAPAQEILFIDTAVANWQQLAADARSGINVVLLDPSRDALAQMAHQLQGRTGLAAIHLVSHGAEGELIIGGQSYDAGSLGALAPQLATIGRALASGGDLLLYGCDVGRGSAGEALISALAKATQADVAASTDTTGAAQQWHGNWVLEAHTGSITSAMFASTEALQQFDGKLATVSLSGASGWTAVMYGASKDPQGDSQAGAADTDIIGDAAHGSAYVAYDDNGTATDTDDTLLFRLRIDNPTSVTNFSGVADVGMDANLDGSIDLFMSVDGRNNGQAVRLLDPGTGANLSPSTTTTSPLPTGWLPNNGVYPFDASNYSVAGVSVTNDPHWNGDIDLGSAGGPDAFVSWRVPIADLATVLAKPSLVDRSGNYGPRGALGIAGYDKNTIVQYVSFTQTQAGTINGDVNGVGAGYDKNASFASLGAFTAP